jgi:hypothetical protein
MIIAVSATLLLWTNIIHAMKCCKNSKFCEKIITKIRKEPYKPSTTFNSLNSTEISFIFKFLTFSEMLEFGLLSKTIIDKCVLSDVLVKLEVKFEREKIFENLLFMPPQNYALYPHFRKFIHRIGNFRKTKTNLKHKVTSNTKFR